MRVRFTLLACALVACAGAIIATAGPAAAAPVRNRGLTIHVAPNPILAGEEVLIYGRLDGPRHAGQPVRLYHRINPAPRFSLIGTTRTNALGEYEFTRPDGIVMTNRSWFVRGPGATHSRTVHERVAALVSLAASASSGLTRHPLTFTGHVTPDHRGAVVALQQQSGASDAWVTVRRAIVGPGSEFAISHAWRVPGAYTVRVLFTGDRRNAAAASDTLPVVIQQTQVPGFTIATTAPVIPNGQPVTISGTLDEPGTATPEPNTSVSLWGHMPGAGQFREISTATTGPDGAYSFPGVQSRTNALYQVRTTFAPHRHSAILFEGVQDAITLASSSPSSRVDGHVTFTGTVSPDKSGHIVLLQKQGADGDWHTVAVRRVGPGSTFQFVWTFGTPGDKTFRARISGGPVNVGGASAPVSVQVSLPPLTSLPTG